MALEDCVRPTTTSVSPDHPVRRFAEIMAALADPFAERASVLSAAGYDAVTWGPVERGWIQRIEQDVSGHLGVEYGQAFERARIAGATANHASRPAPYQAGFLSMEEQPWRHDAAAVKLDASGEAPPLLSAPGPDSSEGSWPIEGDLDRTAELRVPRTGVVLPFSAARPSDESGIRRAPALRRIHEPPIRPALDTAERTLEMPTLTQPRAALPFEASLPGCRRLHRFDTQTGLPLPNAYWSDDAGTSDPTKTA